MALLAFQEENIVTEEWKEKAKKPTRSIIKIFYTTKR